MQAYAPSSLFKLLSKSRIVSETEAAARLKLLKTAAPRWGCAAGVAPLVIEAGGQHEPLSVQIAEQLCHRPLFCWLCWLSFLLRSRLSAICCGSPLAVCGRIIEIRRCRLITLALANQPLKCGDAFLQRRLLRCFIPARTRQLRMMTAASRGMCPVGRS